MPIQDILMDWPVYPQVEKGEIENNDLREMKYIKKLAYF
jgi:hypothetical protein